MKNIDFENINIDVGGRIIDPRSGVYFPWYTKNFLEKLVTMNTQDWRVFEYGAGDSTIWWRLNCREVISVDTNKSWAEKTGSFFECDKDKFLSFPRKFTKDEMFDCIIIDSEPVEWRDECTEHALECLNSGGVIIIDNYNQATVNLEKWPRTDSILESKKKFVFHNPGHADWKTSYWIK